MWKIEIYNRDTRRWTEHGKPTEDFAAAFKKVGQLQETGNKARLVKLADAPKAQDGEAE